MVNGHILVAMDLNNFPRKDKHGYANLVSMRLQIRYVTYVERQVV